jgi:hypothetical protein
MAKRKIAFGAGAFRKAASGKESGVVIIDDVSSFYTIAEKNFPREMSRALRHASYLVNTAVKAYMASSGHGKKLSRVQQFRVVDRAAQGGGRLRNKKFAGDLNKEGKGLYRAVRYQKNKGNKLQYLVGWASNDARKVSGPRFQNGSQHVVTQKMKDFYALSSEKARGKNKRILLRMAAQPVGKIVRVPGRPIFDPVFKIWKSRIPQIIEKRLLKNLGKMSDAAYEAFLSGITAPDKNIRKATQVAKTIGKRKAI